MSPKVTIVDYGMGNLYSVQRAFEYLGADTQLSDRPQDVLEARFLVLPGVGAFGDGMRELSRRHLVEPLRERASAGRKILGICLGMQLFFEASEEFGEHEGLGLLSGRVVAIPRCGADGKPRRIPHVGWTDLQAPFGRTGWSGTPFERLAVPSAMYFVHSYTAVPSDAGDRLADCDYGGTRLSAAVQRKSVIGFQFHPEKSGSAGLAVLMAILGQ